MLKCGVALVLCLVLAPAAVAAPDGVLLYAGFEGSADAVAAGSRKAVGREGGPKFAAGRRGQALLSGDGAGYVEYASGPDLLAGRGSIELWFCAQDWDGTDEKFHVFCEAKEPGWLVLYKYYRPSEGLSGVFLLSGDGKAWRYAKQDLGRIRRGEWHHLVATWNAREQALYLDGKPSQRIRNPHVPPPFAGPLMVGDRPWHVARDGRSLVDELYVYGRALSETEVRWAHEHGLDRAAGADIPEELRPPAVVTLHPSPARKRIRVSVERSGGDGFTGTARLEPAAGTRPAALRAVGKEEAEADIPFETLPAGAYQVKVDLKDVQGKALPAADAGFSCPGPPVWRGNRIGIPKTPPPPWTPLRARGRTVECWGRAYSLGPSGLPDQMRSAGSDLLAAPVSLRASQGGKAVAWDARPARLLSAGPVDARFSGSARSPVGELEWTCRAEFDGLLRYDLTLRPATGAAVDSLELRVPLRPEHAGLHHVLLPTGSVWGDTRYGATPASYRAPWAISWWLGDEERGLCGFCESDEAWDRVDRQDGFRIERTPTSVDAVWSFVGAPKKMDRPWRFTFGLQATPVKSIAGWRKWRMVPFTFASYRSAREWWKTDRRANNVYILWPERETVRYYGYPAAADQDRYRALVKEQHDQGLKVVPYSLITCLSGQSPEWSFYGEEWTNGWVDDFSSDVLSYNGHVMGCSPSADWTDYVVWANQRYVRQFDLDGLYHDITHVMPSRNLAAGCGYVRDGQVRRTYPVFGIREIYKRVYAMLKEHGAARGKDTFMIAHMSTHLVPPILGFSDAVLDGEHFRAVGVKDNYLDVASLDQWRTEFLGRNIGVAPFLLPEFSGEHAKAPEPTRHLVGLSLLHDFALWPIWCNVREFYSLQQALDRFDLRDAQALPYWSNAGILGGQNDTVKCTAYRKPKGGALLCVVNLTRQPQTAALTVAWARLQSGGALSVSDALSDAPVVPEGASLSMALPPLGIRLLRVR